MPGTTAGQTARLLSIADRNGNALTLSYAATSNCAGGALLCTVTDALGRSLNFAYSGNHISQIQDFSGRVFQYGYDGNGNLASFKNPLAVAGKQPPVTYAYFTAGDGASLNHHMKRYTLPRGNGMSFAYYANGRVLSHTDSLGETHTFSYNAFRRETDQVNPRGKTRSFFFDPYGNVSQIIEENGAAYAYGYDTATPAHVHNRLSETNPQGETTQYAYDTAGNVTQVTRPSGATVAFSNYTAYNAPGKIKDADGHYTLLQYDARGNLLNRLRMQAGVGASLDPAAYVPAAADLAAWTRYSYDGYGNRLTVQRLRDLAAQTGPKLTLTYDAQGLNPVSASRTGLRNGVAVNDTATLAADSLGRQTAGITADWYPTQTQYDSVDRVIQATDALGNPRAYPYDANGNPAGDSLTVQGAYGATLADSASATFDLSDRVATRLDAAGNVTAYQYDTNGNLTQITNPDGYTLGFAYDDADHWIQAYDQAGHAVSRSLDPSGRPRSVPQPNERRFMG